MSQPRLRIALWGALVLGFVALGVLAALRWKQAETGSQPPVLAYLPGFLLTERDGREVTLDDLSAGPWVADFIFTRCPGPCPRMSGIMAELGSRLPAGVRRVSFTVDPDHDTPAVLAAYAERFQAGEDWWFLTGPKDAIWDLAMTGFKLGVALADEVTIPSEGPIVHSTRFVVVDAEGSIRGYYDAFDPAEVERLLRDVASLRRPAAPRPPSSAS